MTLDEEIDIEYLKTLILLADSESELYNPQMLKWIRLLEQRESSAQRLEYHDRTFNKKIVVEIAPLPELYRFELRRDGTTSTPSFMILGIFHDVRRVYYVTASDLN